MAKDCYECLTGRNWPSDYGGFTHVAVMEEKAVSYILAADARIQYWDCQDGATWSLDWHSLSCLCWDCRVADYICFALSQPLAHAGFGVELGRRTSKVIQLSALVDCVKCGTTFTGYWQDDSIDIEQMDAAPVMPQKCPECGHTSHVEWPGWAYHSEAG